MLCHAFLEMSMLYLFEYLCLFKVMVGAKEITRNGAKFMDGQEREFDAIVLATGYKSNVPFWLKVCSVNCMNISTVFLFLGFHEISE